VHQARSNPRYSRITHFRRGLPGAAKGTSGGAKGDFRGQLRGLPGAVCSAYKEVKKYKKNKRDSRMQMALKRWISAKPN